MRTVICICTCRRPALLDRLLGVLSGIALGDLDPANLSVVVVDNAPGGEAKEVCERWAGALPFALHYREEPQVGIAFARNRAAREALALDDVAGIAFLDDDDLPCVDWLVQLLGEQRRSGAALVFGFWRFPESTLTPQWMELVPFLGEPRFERRGPHGLPNWIGTYNVWIGRELLEATLAADGVIFRPECGPLGCEDIDFFLRATRRGAVWAASRDAVILRNWEPERTTLWGLMRRSYRNGCIKVLIDRQYLAPEVHREARRKRRAGGLRLFWQALCLPYWMLRGWRSLVVGELVGLARWFGEVATELGFGYR